MSQPPLSQAIHQASLHWMPKSIWGPIKWKELHFRARSDLPMDQELDWFQSFVEGLPCPDCRRHFAEFIDQRAPDFSSRAAFFEWTVEAHNFVNRALNKPSLTVGQALDLYPWPGQSYENV